MGPDATAVRRRAPVVLVAVVGLVALGVAVYLRSLESGNRRIEGTGMTTAQLADVHAELCRTRALAETQLPEARDHFFGRVHMPLHLIAASAGEVDRPRAARMLEAKNDLERAFSQGAPPSEAAAALDRLLASTAEALRSLGVTTSRCETP